MRDALGNKKVKLVARPHAGIDTMVLTAESVGHFCTQMHWTAFRATEGKLLTSDAAVVRSDPGFRGGFYGGGLMSSTAQVWFPLSKKAYLLITPDNRRKRKFFELLENAKIEEAKAVRAELSEISCRDVNAESVLAVNQQTIVKADRFVFSPLESDEIPPLSRASAKIIVS